MDVANISRVLWNHIVRVTKKNLSVRMISCSNVNCYVKDPETLQDYSIKYKRAPQLKKNKVVPVLN